VEIASEGTRDTNFQNLPLKFQSIFSIIEMRNYLAVVLISYLPSNVKIS
jgi:hypothetical protein